MKGQAEARVVMVAIFLIGLLLFVSSFIVAKPLTVMPFANDIIINEIPSLLVLTENENNIYNVIGEENTVRFFVRDEEGRPIQGAYVTVRKMVQWDSSGWICWTIDTPTDENGVLTVTNEWAIDCYMKPACYYRVYKLGYEVVENYREFTGEDNVYVTLKRLPELSDGYRFDGVITVSNYSVMTTLCYGRISMDGYEFNTAGTKAYYYKGYGQAQIERSFVEYKNLERIVEDGRYHLVNCIRSMVGDWENIVIDGTYEVSGYNVEGKGSLKLGDIVWNFEYKVEGIPKGNDLKANVDFVLYVYEYRYEIIGSFTVYDVMAVIKPPISITDVLRFGGIGMMLLSLFGISVTPRAIMRR
jgi:hypothetical protein